MVLLATGLPVLIAGCAGQPVQIGSFAKSVPPEDAILLPPPGGPGILSVIERRYDNALEQDIYIHTSARTPGQNAFRVQMFGTISPFRLSDNKLTSRPVTTAGIATEMRKALPGIRMKRASFYVQNNYGPFGYAFGRGAGGDLCMYAWQQVRAPTGTISPLANHGSIQVRLRLCKANATERELLAVMYHYTITGAVDTAGWNPYGEPQPVSPTLGGIGAPIYPRPKADEPIVPVLSGASRSSKPATYRNRTVAKAPPAREVRPARPAAANPPEVIYRRVPSPKDRRQYEARPTIPTPTADTSRITTGTVTRTPLVPSPSSLPATRRERKVPSPECNTSGAQNDCR